MSEITRFPIDPWNISVARGHVNGHRIVLRTGYNPALSVATTASIWPGTGLYVFPPSASVMTVSSTSALDTAAGTGARTVLVQGLDANYNEIQEVVTLNGQTAVSTTLSYLRLNLCVVTSVGSTGANQGTVYVGSGAVTAGVPVNKYLIATPGYNNSQVSHYTVPNGWFAYNIDLAGSAATSSTNQRTVFAVRSALQGQPFMRGGSVATSGNVFNILQSIVRELPAKTDIDAIADTTDTSVWVTAIQRFLLVKEGISP